MSQLNRPQAGPGQRNLAGGPALSSSSETELRRAVACCLLWEDQFYESGQEIAERIRSLVQGPQVRASFVMDLAREARSAFKLRHAPLLLVRELLRHPGPKPGLAQAISDVIQRPDELAELCALFWKDSVQGAKRKGLPRQLKKGLALAFRKFSPYSLAKYNRDNAVKLRDVLFMCHAKPVSNEARIEIAPIDKPDYKRGPVDRHSTGQGETWAHLVNGTLPTPDTWETALSSGQDKRMTFERLICTGGLGYLALLRNLRNMAEAGCDPDLVSRAILARRGAERVLPYRFIAAAKAAPQFEPALDQAMQASLGEMEKLPGQTLILIDHSASMNRQLSDKSDLTRFEAACGLAILAQGICLRSRIFAFSSELAEIAPRAGMALRDAIFNSMPFHNTYLGRAVNFLNDHIPHDRLIVVTDEQSHDPVPPPLIQGYMLNVASYRPEVGWGNWTRISGWSEAAIRFIQETERMG